MAKKTKAEKAADERVSKAYHATCGGIQIDIMDIGKVYAVGLKAIADGMNDLQLGVIISGYVETIRKN